MIYSGDSPVTRYPFSGLAQIATREARALQDSVRVSCRAHASGEGQEYARHAVRRPYATRKEQLATRHRQGIPRPRYWQVSGLARLRSRAPPRPSAVEFRDERA